MREIKASHEAKFSGALGALENAIVDEMATTQVVYAQSLAKLSTVWPTRLEEKQVAELIEEANSIADCIAQLPFRTRQFLTIVVNRADAAKTWTNVDVEVHHHLIRDATGLIDREVMEQVQTLAHYKIGYGEDDPEERTSLIRLTRFNDWRFWSDLKIFCAEYAVKLEQIIVDLDFGVLD